MAILDRSGSQIALHIKKIKLYTVYAGNGAIHVYVFVKKASKFAAVIFPLKLTQHPNSFRLVGLLSVVLSLALSGFTQAETFLYPAVSRATSHYRTQPS